MILFLPPVFLSLNMLLLMVAWPACYSTSKSVSSAGEGMGAGLIGVILLEYASYEELTRTDLYGLELAWTSSRELRRFGLSFIETELYMC